MSEEKQYVTNFVFPSGETYYVKDEIIPDLDQASLGQVLTKIGENQLGWRTSSGGIVAEFNNNTGVLILTSTSDIPNGDEVSY